MNKKIIFLILFLTFWLIDILMIYVDERSYLFIPRVLSLLSLGLYYVFSVKKVSLKFWILLFFILLTGALFSINDYTLLGMFSLIVLRTSWIRLLLSKKEKIDAKIVLLVFTFSAAIISVIMFTMYVNTSFFYLSILTSITLLLLLAIAFSKLLTNGPKFGNKEMFISIVIFIFSDALSGSKKIEGTTTFFVILSVFLYNMAYFFMIKALIKKDKKLALL